MMTSSYTLIRYSTFFTMDCPSSGRLNSRVNLKQFIDSHLTEYDFHRFLKRMVPSKRYCIINPKTGLAHFPINVIDKLIDFLENNDIQYEIEEGYVPDPKSIMITAKNEFDYRNGQKDIVEFMSDMLSYMKPISAQTGIGKAQPLTSNIKMKYGWKLMKDIAVGDEVTAWDGTYSNVIGVYPQGYKKIYKVTFEDGRFTHCCFEHLWRIYKSKTVNKSYILETKDILDLLNQKKKVYIDLIIPAEVESKKSDGVDIAVSKFLYEELSKPYYDVSIDNDKIKEHISNIRELGGIASFENIDNDKCKIKCSFSNNRLRMISIEYAGIEETQCIEIDHPDKLYITDNFIVTHNTFCSIKAVTLIEKAVMIITSGLTDQWYSEFLKYTNLNPDEIYIIQGFNSLKKLFKMRFPPKVFIFSLATLRQYVYPKKDSQYNNLPPYQEFVEMMGIGIKILDECHTQFHAGVLIDLMSIIPVNIYLSATYERTSKTGQKVFSNIYPEELVYGSTDYKKYVDIYLYSYSLGLMKGLKENTSRGYSQSKYELYINSHRNVYDEFTEEVLKPLINAHFINIKKQKQKLLLLVHTVIMCEKITYSIEELFPYLSVKKYTYEDPEDNLFDGVDIIVSTPKSAGVGKDIKNLRTLLLSCSLASSPLTKQILGRLRELDEDTPVMVDIYNRDIEAHRRHKFYRSQIYRRCGKTFNEVDL